MCELQPPSASCPSCHSPILSGTDRAALISQLEDERFDIIRREEEKKEEERQEVLRQEEIRAGGGGFPTLLGTTVKGSQSGASTPRGSSGRQTPVNPKDDVPRKVLSLNSKTKKITVSKYTPQPPPAVLVQPPKPTAEEEREKERMMPIPRPSDEVEIIGKPPDPQRKWMNLREEGITYVPLRPVQVEIAQGETADGEEKKRKRRRGKGKAPALGSI